MDKSYYHNYYNYLSIHKSILINHIIYPERQNHTNKKVQRDNRLNMKSKS